MAPTIAPSTNRLMVDFSSLRGTDYAAFRIGHSTPAHRWSTWPHGASSLTRASPRSRQSSIARNDPHDRQNSVGVPFMTPFLSAQRLAGAGAVGADFEIGVVGDAVDRAAHDRHRGGPAAGEPEQAQPQPRRGDDRRGRDPSHRPAGVHQSRPERSRTMSTSSTSPAPPLG